jgi:hypothetical protein
VVDKVDLVVSTHLLDMVVAAVALHTQITTRMVIQVATPSVMLVDQVLLLTSLEVDATLAILALVEQVLLVLDQLHKVQVPTIRLVEMAVLV